MTKHKQKIAWEFTATGRPGARWEEQFHRVLRWAHRLKNERADLLSLSVEDGIAFLGLDVFLAFCQNAYHLRDWLGKSGVVKSKIIDEFIAANPYMQLCRDVCNGSKHLVVNNPSLSASPKIQFLFTIEKRQAPEYPALIRMGADYHKLDDFADNFVNAWLTFFNANQIVFLQGEFARKRSG